MDQIPEETSTEQLKCIINSTAPLLHALPGYKGTALGLFGRSTLGVDCDEVYPNLYVGDRNSALNKQYLCRIGITHVLNVAEGTFMSMVNTNAQYYVDIGIQYMGISLIDVPWCAISPYFQSTAEFIHNGIMAGGRVLIHCEKGFSRSPTIALSYLALKVRMPIPMALRMCCTHRSICPNDGFLNQLATLDRCLGSAGEDTH